MASRQVIIRFAMRPSRMFHALVENPSGVAADVRGSIQIWRYGGEIWSSYVDCYDISWTQRLVDPLTLSCTHARRGGTRGGFLALSGSGPALPSLSERPMHMTRASTATNFAISGTQFLNTIPQNITDHLSFTYVRPRRLTAAPISAIHEAGFACSRSVWLRFDFTHSSAGRWHRQNAVPPPS